MALLSFLSNALMLAPLDSSSLTICHTNHRLTECDDICAPRPCAQLNETNLYVSAEGGVVQSRASRAVRHVDVAEQRDQSLGAAHRLVAGRDVQRRLPVLVPGIDIRAVLQQHRHGILDETRPFFISRVGRFGVCFFFPDTLQCV